MRLSKKLRGRLAGEDGFTLIELLVVCLLLGIIMAGLTNVFVSGTRASADMNSRFLAQQNTRTALDRIEFESRCSTTAATVSGGAGVTLVAPSQCTHSTGSISWCVVSGSLRRYGAANCSGAYTTFVDSITSATPFSLLTVSGALPQLVVTMTVNSTNRAADAYTTTDAITLRNAARTP